MKFMKDFFEEVLVYSLFRYTYILYKQKTEIVPGRSNTLGSKLEYIFCCDTVTNLCSNLVDSL